MRAEAGGALVVDHRLADGAERIAAAQCVVVLGEGHEAHLAPHEREHRLGEVHPVAGVARQQQVGELVEDHRLAQRAGDEDDALGGTTSGAAGVEALMGRPLRPRAAPLDRGPDEVRPAGAEPGRPDERVHGALRVRDPSPHDAVTIDGVGLGCVQRLLSRAEPRHALSGRRPPPTAPRASDARLPAARPGA